MLRLLSWTTSLILAVPGFLLTWWAGQISTLLAAGLITGTFTRPIFVEALGWAHIERSKDSEWYWSNMEFWIFGAVLLAFGALLLLTPLILCAQNQWQQRQRNPVTLP